jgi:hypothetical protein
MEGREKPHIDNYKGIGSMTPAIRLHHGGFMRWISAAQSVQYDVLLCYFCNNPTAYNHSRVTSETNEIVNCVYNEIYE